MLKGDLLALVFFLFILASAVLLTLFLLTNISNQRPSDTTVPKKQLEVSPLAYQALSPNIESNETEQPMAPIDMPLCSNSEYTTVLSYGNVYLTTDSADKLADKIKLVGYKKALSEITDLDCLTILVIPQSLRYDLRNLPIDDLSPLTELPNLRSLYLFAVHVKVSDLSKLAGLTNLTEIEIMTPDYFFEDWSKLRSIFPNLESCTVSDYNTAASIEC